jgi:IclR family transcriptional regulator, KDG regulon repressor
MDNVRSITRAVQILETFRQGSVLTTAELARALRIPKSSIYEILRTLTDEGLVERMDGHYRLGLRLIELAHTAVQDLEVGRVGRPLLQRLRDELNETVQLTVLYGEEVLYVEGYESTHQLRTFFELGDRAPLYCTALGKAILAFRGETEIQKVTGQKELRAFTSRTLTDGSALRRDLERTVARGYAIDDREHEEGVRCVAAPIRSRHGVVFASISVSGPAHRMTKAREVEIASRTVEAANEISQRIGYHSAGKMPARARQGAVQGGGRK